MCIRDRTQYRRPKPAGDGTSESQGFVDAVAGFVGKVIGGIVAVFVMIGVAISKVMDLFPHRHRRRDGDWYEDDYDDDRWRRRRRRRRSSRSSSSGSGFSGRGGSFSGGGASGSW